MTNLTLVQQSPAPEDRARAVRRRSIAAKIRDLGQARTGAVLLLLLVTLAAVIWANVSIGSYHGFWETHLTVGVGDIQLDFTLHALVNDALMAIFFFTVGLEVRREFAIGELTSWSRAMVPVIAAVAGLVIALEAGFGSLSQFYARFRERTGEPPAAYRRRLTRSDP